MRKKPYTAEELFNTIMEKVQRPEFIEYASPTGTPRDKVLIKDYQFDLYTRVVYGTNEGIYADVWLSGKYDEEAGAPDLLIGVIKTLNRDDDTVRKMYQLCAEIFLAGTHFINDNLDDFTWLGYRIELSEKSGYDVANPERVVRKLAELKRWGRDISDLKILNLSTRKYEKNKDYIKKAEQLYEEQQARYA